MFIVDRKEVLDYYFGECSSSTFVYKSYNKSPSLAAEWLIEQLYEMGLVSLSCQIDENGDIIRGFSRTPVKIDQDIFCAVDGV